MVLPVGHLVYGIDPVNRRVLWEANLAAGGTEPYKVHPAQPNGPMWDQQHPPLVDPRDGSVLLTYPTAGRSGSVRLDRWRARPLRAVARRPHRPGPAHRPDLVVA